MHRITLALLALLIIVPNANAQTEYDCTTPPDLTPDFAGWQAYSVYMAECVYDDLVIEGEGWGILGYVKIPAGEYRVRVTADEGTASLSTLATGDACYYGDYDIVTAREDNPEDTALMEFDQTCYWLLMVRSNAEWVVEFEPLD